MTLTSPKSEELRNCNHEATVKTSLLGLAGSGVGLQIASYGVSKFRSIWCKTSKRRSTDVERDRFIRSGRDIENSTDFSPIAR